MRRRRAGVGPNHRNIVSAYFLCDEATVAAIDAFFDPDIERTEAELMRPLYRNRGAQAWLDAVSVPSGPPPSIPAWVKGNTWRIRVIFAAGNYSQPDGPFRSEFTSITNPRVLGRFQAATGIPRGVSLDPLEVPPEDSTVLDGRGFPDEQLGVDGDYYVDDDRGEIYGPKAAGSWGLARDQYTGTANVLKPAWMYAVVPPIVEYDEQDPPQPLPPRDWDEDQLRVFSGQEHEIWRLG